MQKVQNSFLLLLIGLIFSACSSSDVNILNEGAIEHRKFTYTKTNIGKEGQNTVSTPLRQFENSDSKDLEIKENDSFSIHLMQGMIESLPYADEAGTEKGEIAIVIKAHELTETKDLELSEKSADSGRLIYYSDDVSPKQILNFSYLPVYGPITYHGNPVAIQIFIIEIKKTNSQIKPILTSLAQSGSAMLPPGSPTLSLLDNLGSVLLNSNKENIIFRYSMVLHPKGSSKVLPFPKLEVSNLVFVRQEDRQETLDWAKLSFNPNDGRLYEVNETGGEKREKLFRDHTYISMQIQKGFDPTKLDLAYNTYKGMNILLSPETYRNGQEFESVVKGYMNDQYRAGLFGKLRTTLNSLPTVGASQFSRRDRMAYSLVSNLAEQIIKERRRQQDRSLDSAQIDYLLDGIKKLMPTRKMRHMVHRDNFYKNQKVIISRLSKSTEK